MSPLMQVLDEARWAPSGDNTQPWRFELRGERELTVHGFDTRSHCVYDLRGEASQLSIGAMLETMTIAATRHGWSTTITRRTAAPDTHPTFDVRFEPIGLASDKLVECIRRRTVQRRAMRTRPLSAEERQAMERAAGPAHHIRWMEGFVARWRCAQLMFNNAHLRLTMPEAYEVHRAVIEWHARESVDRVPDQALGADPVALVMMRFAMKSWSRVHFANRFLAGTWVPRLQLDLIPSMRCAAHLVIVADREPVGIDDFVAAGRAVQRVWLTATQLGLWQQPEMTPLIFSRYARQGVRYTKVQELQGRAENINEAVRQMLGDEHRRAVWMGRMGAASAPTARSVRLPLDRLLISGQQLASLGGATSAHPG